MALDRPTLRDFLIPAGPVSQDLESQMKRHRAYTQSPDDLRSDNLDRSGPDASGREGVERVDGGFLIPASANRSPDSHQPGQPGGRSSFDTHDDLPREGDDNSTETTT